MFRVQTTEDSDFRHQRENDSEFVGFYYCLLLLLLHIDIGS